MPQNLDFLFSWNNKGQENILKKRERARKQLVTRSIASPDFFALSHRNEMREKSTKVEIFVVRDAREREKEREREREQEREGEREIPRE